ARARRDAEGVADGREGSDADPPRGRRVAGSGNGSRRERDDDTERSGEVAGAAEEAMKSQKRMCGPGLLQRIARPRDHRRSAPTTPEARRRSTAGREKRKP